jgi:thiazole synthase
MLRGGKEGTLHHALTVRGLRLERLWHCFGTDRHRATLDLIVDLLAASKTNVLPVNTHRLGPSRVRETLEHGFAGVPMDRLAERMDVSSYVKMLNINLRKSAAGAVRAAQVAVDMTGERVLKLEVLAPDLRRSNDEEVLEAASRLLGWQPSLLVFPLISADVEVAKQAIDIGCPLLRVMGASIGSGRGISHPQAFEEICSLPVPVVLDGGVGHPHHVQQAVRLGAQAVLVNSALFDSGRQPVAVLRDFRVAVAQAFDLDG